MSTVFATILRFITESPVEYITAASVIYKAMEVNSAISKNELLQLSIEVINTVLIDRGSNHFKKLNEIPKQVNFKYFKNFFYVK